MPAADALRPFMVVHTFAPGELTPEMAAEVDRVLAADPVVRGYRCFLNFSEGKAFCVIEAPDEEALRAWFKARGVPFDSITAVELEDERGVRVAPGQ